jgi:hypothetical protein
LLFWLWPWFWFLLVLSPGIFGIHDGINCGSCTHIRIQDFRLKEQATPGIPFLRPGFTALVVTIAFPKTQGFVIQKFQALQPLAAFPSI